MTHGNRSLPLLLCSHLRMAHDDGSPAFGLHIVYEIRDFTSDRDCETAVSATSKDDPSCLLSAFCRLRPLQSLRRRSFQGVVDGMSVSYCFNEAVLGSCACCGFVLLAAGAFLGAGLLTLLACCSCFWSFLPAVGLADAGFTRAVLA